MLYPMFALVLLTFLIGILTLKARIASVRLKQINLGYFRLMQAKVTREVPERVTVTTRCYNNMFEIPLLFYVVGIIAIARDTVTPFSIIIAWGFVLSRCLHTWIHLTSNHLTHRMVAYLLGMILVLALWIEQVLQAI